MQLTNKTAKIVGLTAINLIVSTCANAERVPVIKDTEILLTEAQQLYAKGRHKEAIFKVEALIKEVPNFRAAHLLLGDILLAKSGQYKVQDVFQKPLSNEVNETLINLRTESKLRLQAQEESPPTRTVPSQFVALTEKTKHAIAVDASKSRLYFFENSKYGLILKESFYISVGKLGTEKKLEGDQKTPLGVYFLSRKLKESELPTLYGKGFYGTGALTLNYPNQLDVLRGKTGGGIWLHGTPPNEYARAPKSTNGCVVLSNPQLDRIKRLVQLGSTPFVIANSIQWVAPNILKSEQIEFNKILASWHKAKQMANYSNLASFYHTDYLKSPKAKDRLLMSETQNHQPFDASKFSIFRWKDSNDTMIATYSETSSQSKGSKNKRLYWTKDGAQWKIFFEGEVS